MSAGESFVCRTTLLSRRRLIRTRFAPPIFRSRVIPEFAARSDAQLREQSRDVVLDRALRSAQALCDGAVAQALVQQPVHAALARGEAERVGARGVVRAAALVAHISVEVFRAGAKVCVHPARTADRRGPVPLRIRSLPCLDALAPAIRPRAQKSAAPRRPGAGQPVGGGSGRAAGRIEAAPEPVGLLEQRQARGCITLRKMGAAEPEQRVGTRRCDA